MTARVSFPDRAKRTAAALGWIVAFGIAGGASGWAVSRLGPDPSPAWALAWTSLSGAVGFGLATLLVGRVLDRRSWAYLGWRPRAGVPAGLLGGVLLGAGMAAGAAEVRPRAAVEHAADEQGREPESDRPGERGPRQRPGRA